MANCVERIEHIFDFMEYGQLSDAQFNLVESFEQQFLERRRLSENQYQILEDIFKRAAERA